MTRQIMPSEYTWQASVCPRFLPELRHSPKSLSRVQVSALAVWTHYFFFFPFLFLLGFGGTGFGLGFGGWWFVGGFGFGMSAPL